MFAAWLMIVLIPKASADAHLDVRARVRLESGTMATLADLCDVDDPKLARDLAMIDVARAPAKLGAAKLLDRLRPLVTRARENGLAVHVRVPKVVEISTDRPFDAAAVSAELTKLWAAKTTGQIEIVNLTLPRVADVRDWALANQPDLPRGGFSVPLTLTRKNGATSTAFASGVVRVKRLVPVARRLITPGERIETGDFKMEERDVALAFDGIPDVVAGKRARRGFSLNEIIWAGALERERAIRRGDQVNLKTGDGEWEVSVNVTAPEDASVGDVVTFKRSGSVLIGRVTGPGEAEVR